jgi:phosphatidylglycerophosphate synthase
MVLVAFVLARFHDNAWLWLAIVGLAVNWLGDSLDGRLAYFRNIPRKWYGFSLDIVMDWLSTALIGAGSLIYASERGQMLTYAIVVMYGWAMIITQLRYKITDSYQIDSGLMGPTEFRVILSLIIGTTYFFPMVFETTLALAAFVLLLVNISETNKLLTAADAVDQKNKSSQKRG